MKRLPTTGVLLLGITCAIPHTALADITDACCVGGFVYTGGIFTTVNYPGHSPQGIFIKSINDSGQIVGLADGWGFIETAGVFTQLGYPGFNPTPTGINDTGQVVGNFVQKNSSGGYNSGAFLYSGGVFTALGYNGAITGVNDNGQIVGYGGGHGVLYEGGVFTALDYPGSDYTQLTGINDSGQIVGYFLDHDFQYNGFIYSGGVFTILNYPGSFSTRLTGINDNGQIVGNTGGYGFVYSDGLFTPIRFDDGRGTYSTEITGINDSGQIVGHVSQAPERIQLWAIIVVFGMILGLGKLRGISMSNGPDLLSD